MKRSKPSSALKRGLLGLLYTFLITASLGVTFWAGQDTVRIAALKDTRLVSAVLVYQCEELQGLLLIPQHSAPVWKPAGDTIPLDFYKEAVLLSKNGVLKFTVPCPHPDNTAS